MASYAAPPVGDPQAGRAGPDPDHDHPARRGRPRRRAGRHAPRRLGRRGDPPGGAGDAPGGPGPRCRPARPRRAPPGSTGPLAESPSHDNRPPHSGSRAAFACRAIVGRLERPAPVLRSSSSPSWRCSRCRPGCWPTSCATSDLARDDFAYVARFSRPEAAWLNLLEPHNTHIVPLFRVWTYVLVRAAGRLSDLPATLVDAAYLTWCSPRWRSGIWSPGRREPGRRAGGHGGARPLHVD